jgi:lipoprotein-anchoring transpeptidase ErfK/SrfK
MKVLNALLPFLIGLIVVAQANAQQRLPSTSPSAASHPVESVTSRLTSISYYIYERAKLGANPLEGLTAAQLAIVEKLNRANTPRLKRMKTVVMPATWSDDELAYSPFPQEYGWAGDKAQAIVVDQTAQAFAAYEHGRLVRWGPVSTGSAGQTPAGLFNLSWRSRGHRSSVNRSWYLEWYFNFIPSRGIAFHKYSLPGQAASQGCVRMLERDARWLYGWGTKGTPVIVLGCPDGAKQWQDAWFLQSGVVLPDEPSKVTRDCRGYAGATPATQRRTIR